MNLPLSLRPPLPAAAALVILATAAMLYLTAPTAGGFWWSDAPRHALNGVFLTDFLRDLPLAAPKDYALAYYAKYPALTILFYPPLFYVISTPFYALFGVSHGVAQLVVALHYAVLGLGLYALLRRGAGGRLALAGTIAAMCAPEVALWGRQVMLEIPSLAFAVWSAVLLLDYCARPGDAWRLYAAFALLLAAAYTKLTWVFLVPVYGLLLLQTLRVRLLRNPQIYVVAGLFVIGMMPLLLMVLWFGQANVQSVIGVADAVAPRWSVAGWTWYAARLPQQFGWPLLALAMTWLVLLPFDRRLRQAGAPMWLAIWWFVVAYAFFSLVDLKEARHTLLLVVPLIWAATHLLSRLPRPAAATAVGAALAAGMATYAAALQQVPRVDGYREAAAYVAEKAPRDSVILFSGKRDGSFIFNVRAREDRRDLSVLRADKLLLRIVVRRELGVGQSSYGEEEIADRINAAGVHYVVAQSDFWTDLQQMARLQSVLRSDRFEEVARIAIASTAREEDTELRIYRNRGPVAEHPIRPDLDLPIIGTKIPGS